MKRTVRQRITHAATYTKRGQYWYKGDDTKHPCEQRLCATCGKTFFGRRDQPGLFCSKHCMQMGENNTMWKGKDAGYMAQHGRVYRELGPANSCPWDHPGPYQWAHNTGERGLPDEYVSMCVPCHRRFDTAMAKCLPHLCGNGLHMLDTNADFYVKIRADGTEIRQCRQCAKDRAAKRRHE
jgi:hypothetical protein